MSDGKKHKKDKSKRGEDANKDENVPEVKYKKVYMPFEFRYLCQDVSVFVTFLDFSGFFWGFLKIIIKKGISYSYLTKNPFYLI